MNCATKQSLASNRMRGLEIVRCNGRAHKKHFKLEAAKKLTTAGNRTQCYSLGRNNVTTTPLRSSFPAFVNSPTLYAGSKAIRSADIVRPSRTSKHLRTRPKPIFAEANCQKFGRSHRSLIDFLDLTLALRDRALFICFSHLIWTVNLVQPTRFADVSVLPRV
jgi:hypothetical protein